MVHADQIRNVIIDKLLYINDEEYLTALLHLLENTNVKTEDIKLSNSQKSMLEMSLSDIKNDRLISQEELDKLDLEWLNEK